MRIELPAKFTKAKKTNKVHFYWLVPLLVILLVLQMQDKIFLQNLLTFILPSTIAVAVAYFSIHTEKLIATIEDGNLMINKGYLPGRKTALIIPVEEIKKIIYAGNSFGMTIAIIKS